MFEVIGQIQKAVGSVPVVGTGFSYLRQFLPNAAAGEIKAGRCSMAGLGRMSLARPEFPKEIMDNVKVDPRLLCTTCGKCAGLLRAGGPSYCAVFNKDNL